VLGAKPARYDATQPLTRRNVLNFLIEEGLTILYDESKDNAKSNAERDPEIGHDAIVE
jgi:hypothetical protein